MTATHNDTIAELQRAIADLRTERDAVLALCTGGYDERIAHQGATVDVVKAKSTSPIDPQPMFDLIVERARDLCAREGGADGLFPEPIDFPLSRRSSIAVWPRR
ncbi:MAG TPA: hypothetical protein VHS58_17800 [Acetobacteraceae bacterium]|nr:hypothetical protein [Acetobacteraceae bacterium]